MDYPRLREAFFYLFFATLCLALVLKVKELPEWLRLFLTLAALLLGIVGVFSLIDWISHHASERLKEFNHARTLALVLASSAVKPLNDRQLEEVKHYRALQIDGILGKTGVAPRIAHTVQTPLGPVPIEAFQDFLEWSAPTEPFTQSIHSHSEFREKYEWKNAEWLLTAMTKALIDSGWAEPNAGNKSARLLYPYGLVCHEFGMERKL